MQAIVAYSVSSQHLLLSETIMLMLNEEALSCKDMLQ